MSTGFAVAFGRRLVVLLLCVSMTTVGCASHQPDPSLTPEQNALRAQKANWNKTMLTGAAVGAATGAAIGLAAGGGNRGAVAGIAALGGLLIGAAVGALIADRNLEFENRELNAEQRIAAAQVSTQNLQARAATAEALAAKDRARLDELDQQYRANQITAAKYRAEASSIRKDLELIKESSEDAKSARAKITTSSQDVPALMAEEPKMGEAQQRLEQSANQIEEKLNRIPST